MKKLKLFNDPIYGFITIKNPLIFTIIEHPYFQRLRRISQMGLSYLVYPGAHHTRFQHLIGCTFLMQKAVEILRLKGSGSARRKRRPFRWPFSCMTSATGPSRMPLRDAS